MVPRESAVSKRRARFNVVTTLPVLLLTNITNAIVRLSALLTVVSLSNHVLAVEGTATCEYMIVCPCIYMNRVLTILARPQCTLCRLVISVLDRLLRPFLQASTPSMLARRNWGISGPWTWEREEEMGWR